uniref:ATP-binding protein n=1 Tax=Candidatus Caldatribacterium saccharofermentans TaxID=1454753 RepID=A0A7V4WMA9_9BACT
MEGNYPLASEGILALLNGEVSSESRQKKSQAQELLALAIEHGDFWTSPDGVEFVTFAQSGPSEHWPLDSRRARQWLAGLYYEAHGKPLSSQTISDVVELLKWRAVRSNKRIRVHLRIAKLHDILFLDLCDDSWQAVEITKHGWRVCAPYIAFRRTRGMLPLPHPEDGEIELLRNFLNVDDEGFVLVISWLVAAMREEGPFPILLLEGEQGSGKSTAARVLRSLVDPNACPLRSIPREERDLMIAARNAWVLAFDNLSGIPPWLSDTLCRLATGGGFATRKLYTDADEELFSAMRPIVCTGIDDIGSRHDFLDRCIRVVLPPIPDEKRKDEATFWSEFERVRPKILGGLLDAVCAGLKNWGNTKLDRLPRMADFARWVVACEEALPWRPGTFLEVYSENRQETILQATELDPFICALRNLVSEGEWEGTPTELLAALSSSVSEAVKRSSSWPSTPERLGRKIKRSMSFLRALGIAVESYRKSGGSRTRVYRIFRESPDKTVPTVPTVPNQEKDQENQGFRGGTVSRDSNGGGTDLLSRPKPAPEAGWDGRDGRDSNIPTFSKKPHEQGDGWDEIVLE